MTIAGCYTLHLYCDNANGNHAWGEFPHELTHELGSSCRKEARRRGWVFHRNGTVTCPKCPPRHIPASEMFDDKDVDYGVREITVDEQA